MNFDDFSETIDDVLRSFPELQHLAGRVKRIKYLDTNGAEQEGVETSSMLPVLEEVVVIAERHPRNRRLREMGLRVAGMLPTLRAFDADPLTVLASGVN
jgi:hypothetical protein